MLAVIVSLDRDYYSISINEDVANVEGFIVSEVSSTEKTHRFIFETLDHQKYLIYTDTYSRLFYGDKISITGNIKIPEDFENENGIVFDYRNYLLKDGITHTSFYPDVSVIEKNSKKDHKFYIFKIKDYFVQQSNKIFNYDTSKLVLGIIFGIKDSIDQNLEENFRRTGLIHILVLSGFNLTIIAYFVFWLLSFLHRNIRYLLSFLFIIIFVIMVGAGATIVRAGIMISLFIFSKLLRRNSFSANSLFLAGSIMIFINPMILLHDPSFQLSFVATLGLVSFYDLINNMLKFIPEKFSIREIVVSNISVQITVVPMLMYLMGEFSVISLVPNLLVLPIIPLFMAVSFIAISISFISSPLSMLVIYISEKISDWMIFVVTFFGDLEFSIIKTGIISTQFLLSTYLVFLSVILSLDIRNKITEKQKYKHLLL